MKRLQMPQNKLARLAINIVFVPLWLELYSLIIQPVGFYFVNLYDLHFGYYLFLPPLHRWIVLPTLVDGVFAFTPFTFCFIYLPIGIATIYIWWGGIVSKKILKPLSNNRICRRLIPRPRVTRSKDD